MPENARWERDHRPNQFKSRGNGDANQSKRDQRQPHQRIKDQCQQSQRPTQNKEDAPEKKFDHVTLLQTLLSTGGRRDLFPQQAGAIFL